MTTYRYTARDMRGKAMSGTMSAATIEVLADQLKRKGYLVTRSHPVSERLTVEGLWQWLRGVGLEEVVLVQIQLAKMLQVGIPLLAALTTIEEQTDHQRMGHVLADVARAVETGQSFSEALQQHGEVFSPLCISMVKAGELSGQLDQTLQRLAESGQRQIEWHEQLKTALTYPCLLLLVGTGVMLLLITGIIPRFMKIFLDAKVPLPLPTRCLYALGQLILHQWASILVGIVAIGWLCRWLLRTPAGRRRFDRTLLHLPVIGPLARKMALSRFARTFAMLVSSGVPMLESLAIVEQTAGNVVIGEVLGTVQRTVRQGGSLAEPLRASGEFPPMVVQMVTVGEASGALDDMLQHVADYYDQVVRYGMRRATALVEPIFLMLMGGLVALVMASILLPLFRLVNVIH